MRKLAVLCLVGLLLISACSRSKDIMAVANLKSLANLTITDRVGNQVTVKEVKAFEEAFRKATAKTDSDRNLAILAADYRLEVGSTVFYYFSDGTYLVYQDGSKTHLYQTNLTQLIASQFTSGPGGETAVTITEGAPTAHLRALATTLAQVRTPVAYLVEHGDQSVFIFAAGEQNGVGFNVSVNKTTETGRGFIVDFEVNPPVPNPHSQKSYPYTVLTFSKKVNAIARTTEGSQIKEWPTIRMEPDQQVVLIQPRSGSLLTQRIVLLGKASVPGGQLQVEIEDGHRVLVQESITVSAAAPNWGDFEVTLDLEMPTNLSGTIIFFTEAGTERHEFLLIPVLFTGGK